MEASESKELLRQLLREANEICDVAKTAFRNRKSLVGDNHYGRKFHSCVVKISTTHSTLKPVISSLDLPLESFEPEIQRIKSPETAVVQRTRSLKALSLFVLSEVIPRIDSGQVSPVSRTEQVLPMSVVKKTRTYFEKIIMQANGSFEHQWFDACSVMIRRFVETLIIELYEAKSISANIKDGNGDFLMLGKLIDNTLSEKSWNLSRETKRTLPLVKSLGDRSAHNRRYVATKRDVDEVIPGLRVLADEMLHLAGLK